MHIWIFKQSYFKDFQSALILLAPKWLFYTLFASTMWRCTQKPLANDNTEYLFTSVPWDVCVHNLHIQTITD